MAVRELRVSCRPFDPEVAVIPRDRALVARLVVLADAVDDICVVTDDAEPVREPGRDVKLMVIDVIQAEPYVLTEGGLTAADVHDHVLDCPTRDPYELRLARRHLKVEAAQRPAD